MVCQLGYCTCHIIVIEGIDGVGKSTLVNQLQSKLCQAYVNVSLVEPVDKNSSPENAAEARLIARFSQHLRALRIVATHESGALLDGSLAGEVARIESDLYTGRLSGPRATEVLRLGKCMLSRLPPPHVVIILEASPETCLKRSAGSRRTIAELQVMESSLRQQLASLGSNGCRVHSRAWETFGSPNQVRDTILCVPPVTKRYSELAPPSESAAADVLAEIRASLIDARARAPPTDGFSGVDTPAMASKQPPALRASRSPLSPISVFNPL
mmetsp:Transcript_38082/g.122446  ORF Transcript_38082/g.122446 Transcript_38082/m.122446 type:complete len:270 (-) Transcript_38082:411-1220(-)